MLRSNIIYTFLLGILFLSFGLSVDQTDDINIHADNTSQGIVNEVQDEKVVLSPRTLKTVATLDNQHPSPKNWNQKEMFFLLMELKKIQGTHRKK